jgi:hypothetical protein
MRPQTSLKQLRKCNRNYSLRSAWVGLGHAATQTVRYVHVGMAFKATHYAWRGRNSGEGQSTFWAQFPAKSFTFCRRGNASAIRKLSGSNLGHGPSIQRSPCLHDRATPPDHDLKTYGARGGKVLMQLETAMDGGRWRPSGWRVSKTHRFKQWWKIHYCGLGTVNAFTDM